jgi:tight adherence protein B
MLFNVNDIFSLVAAVTTFCLVLSVWLAVVLLWAMKRSSRHKTIRERLQTEETVEEATRPLRLWHEGREGIVRRPMMRRVTLEQRLRRVMHRAGIEVHVQSLLGGIVAVVIALFFLSYAVARSPLPAVGAVALTAITAYLLLQRRITRQQSIFETQFVDALDLAARSLRAGHPLIGAFQLISTEIGAPVGRLFAEICQAQELGLGVEKAVQEVSKTTDNSDVAIFGTSIAIQLRSGGNLADMVERLAFVIRDRMRLSRRIRVLTAQTQYSKRILTALPIVVFLVLNMINPQYMEPLYLTTMGRVMLIIAVVSVIVGVWFMNRLTILDY